MLSFSYQLLFLTENTDSHLWDLPNVNLPLMAADKVTATAEQVLTNLNRGMVTLCGDNESTSYLDRLKVCYLSGIEKEE